MPSRLREPSIFSDPQATQSKCPPDTVLLAWNNELLLLDAWDPTGTRLRTPPSLINEAITHFQLEYDIKDLRLAVQERVDGVPRKLYLGISALRFIENGRVLELVLVGNCGTAHLPRKPAIHAHLDHRQGDLEMPKDRSRSTSPGEFKTAMSTPAEGLQTFEEIGHQDKIPLIASHPLQIQNQSSCEVIEQHEAHRVGASTYIYVHPTYGALFAHLARDPEGSRDVDDGAVHQAALTSRPSTPGESRRQHYSRQNSPVKRAEGTAGQGHIASIETAWLGDGEEQRRAEPAASARNSARPSQSSRSSSADKSAPMRHSLPRPALSARSRSRISVATDSDFPDPS